jgi:hypothetical protein
VFPLAKLPWFGHAETAVLVGLIERISRAESAADIEEVATLATERACGVLGLASSALWLIDASGDLALAATHGASAASVSGWQWIAKDAKGSSGTLSPDRHAHAIQVIERNARIQEQLIGDLLDMSRVISGVLAPEDRERTAAAGFDIHVGKPIDPERLVELLRRLRHPAGAAS